MLTVTCDIRIIRVSDGSAISQATGTGTSDDLGSIAQLAVNKLNADDIHGESIAVASLRNRNGSSASQVIADELGDKITGSLIAAGDFDVKERIDLRAILDEKDLELAEIVTESPQVRQKLSGIKYLVVGGVTAAE